MICAADSMSIFSSFHAIIFESLTVGASQTGAKKDLMRNSHSGSFKVMHFGITEKLTTDCVSLGLYNNAGLNSKVSQKIASES